MFSTAGFGLYSISVILLTGIQLLPDWLSTAAKHNVSIHMLKKESLFSYNAVKLLDCSYNLNSRKNKNINISSMRWMDNKLKDIQSTLHLSQVSEVCPVSTARQHRG